jgi:hypothetical protein
LADVADSGVATFRISFWRVLSWALGYGLSVGLIVGAISSYLAGQPLAIYMFVVAAVAGLLVGMLLVAIMVAVFATRVGATHVKAFDVWGLPRTMEWHEMVSARVVNIAGLAFIRVAGGVGRPLWIPLFHRRQQDFAAAVRELSPHDNVLQAALPRTGA